MKRAMQMAAWMCLVAGFLSQWKLEAADTATAPTAEAEAKRLRAQKYLEQEVEEARGLKFLKPVAYRSMKSAEFRPFLVKKIRQQYTPAQMRDYSRSLAMVGLLPEGTDFEAQMMEVMDEQVAAFYDQDKAELYTFTDSPLTSNLRRMIVVHEVTHALQDQHFHIRKWPLKRKDNDDLVAAHMALLEGDATQTMAKVYMRGLDVGSALTDLIAALAQNTEKFMRAPRYFRDMLLFPYQEGQGFVVALEQMGGRELVNRAFENPPTSTSQVLHPDKFHPRREDPVAVQPQTRTEAGWRRLATNVVGEFGIIVLLRQFGHARDASEIAAGWRGDRYVAFDTGKGNGLLCWSSQWSSPEAARRFVEAYRHVVLKRNAERQPSLRLDARVMDGRVDLTLFVPAVAADQQRGKPCERK
ncbi:MAG: hypothetical protein N2689_14940 [Verrucomicrobiae bacterium]|nr:hypothetical protein [Verrucomicrobiae bacterium]